MNTQSPKPPRKKQATTATLSSHSPLISFLDSLISAQIAVHYTHKLLHIIPIPTPQHIPSSNPPENPTMFSKLELPSTKSLISAAASAAATAVLIRSIARDLIPPELTQYFRSKFNLLLTSFSKEMTIIIDEYDGLTKNHLFTAAHLYVTTLTAPSTRLLRATLPEKERKIQVSLGGNEEIIDEFDNIHLKWRMVTKTTKAPRYDYSDEFRPTLTSEYRFVQLTFHKWNKNRVIDEYLPYVLERSRAVKEEKKTLKLHTLTSDRIHGSRMSPWQSVILDHPAKFETLAMDDEIKKAIIDDLDRFVKRKEFYRKVGKAWKRGYLLFGPPGTGKSSLIAAMANYLNFDVYDLELTDIRYNSDLRRLLISTANRSIIVVEDIDASIDLSERKNGAAAKTPPPSHFPPFQQNQGPKVTLSGLLNFIDGLWSSMGDERIIIFTTNHKDKLDPALLRPGRMDVHIHMSYCTPCGFKMLANNYLSISEHPLLSEAEGLIAATKVTPAEVGEQLLKSDDPEAALRGLIKFLELKKVEDLAREENLKVSNQGSMLKIENVPEGLKELMKIANASSFGEMSSKIMKKDEAADALKVLVEFLGEEIGVGNVEGKDLGASVGSEIEDGIKTH